MQCTFIQLIVIYCVLCTILCTILCIVNYTVYHSVYYELQCVSVVERGENQTGSNRTFSWWKHRTQ